MRTLRTNGLASEPMSFIRGILLVPKADFDFPPELGQHLAPEPGVLPQPEPVARAGVGEGKELRQILASRAHGVRDGLFPSFSEVVRLRVAADEEREADRGQTRAQPRVPAGSAFGPRRQIARFSGSRIAESGRNDRDAALVVESLPVEAQPLAQQIAGRIVPGNPALVHAPARCLPDDHQARAGRGAQDRPGGIGKVRSAQRAGADLGKKSREAGRRHPHVKIGVAHHTGPSMPPLSPLSALSPLDGRYHKQLEPLRTCFSEAALFRHRIAIEVRWLLALAGEPALAEIKPFSKDTNRELERVVAEFTEEDAAQVKAIEAETNHDVKAIEYWLKRRLAGNPEDARVAGFVHFACTSEDINNLAYGLMLREGRDRVLLPALDRVVEALAGMARSLADAAMLSRTHGQPASPTTLGKELANFAHRLRRARKGIAAVSLAGKMNGAVGNYNAHVAAYPGFDWEGFAKRFVEALGLEFNPYTIQI